MPFVFLSIFVMRYPALHSNRSYKRKETAILATIKTNFRVCPRLLKNTGATPRAKITWHYRSLGNRSSWELGWAHGSKFGVVLEEVLFQFGENVLAVGVFSQRVAVRPDFVHEDFSLGRLRHVDHLLNHVVGVLVFHHDVKWTLSSAIRYKSSALKFWHTFSNTSNFVRLIASKTMLTWRFENQNRRIW